MGRLFDQLIARREEVLACLARHRASNPRVFGSVARGEEGADSDIDLLLEFDDEASLFDAFSLQAELQALPAEFRAALRDKPIHDYFEVDLAPVWTTASREIPALLPRLEALPGAIDPKTRA